MLGILYFLSLLHWGFCQLIVHLFLGLLNHCVFCDGTYMLHRTVGELLAAKAHCKFYDADNFHSAANKGAQPTIHNMHFISSNDARAY